LEAAKPIADPATMDTPDGVSVLAACAPNRQSSAMGTTLSVQVFAPRSGAAEPPFLTNF